MSVTAALFSHSLVLIQPPGYIQRGAAHVPGENNAFWVAPIPSQLLQRLPNLTRLELTGGLSNESLEHLGSLAKVSHLVLGGLYQVNPAGLQGVNSLEGLTHLQLTDIGCDYLGGERFTCKTMPGFVRLTIWSIWRYQQTTGWRFRHRCCRA